MGTRKTIYTSAKATKEQNNTAKPAVEDTPSVDDAVTDAQLEQSVEAEAAVQEELPPPEVTASSYPRIDLLKSKLAEFKELYPTNAYLTPTQTNAMARHIEMCIAIMLDTQTYTETAMAISELRATFHANENNVFSKARILGTMIEPRTGRYIVSNPQIASIASLLFITMSPKLFAAQKGRIDVVSFVTGLPENIANNIIQYYS